MKRGVSWSDELLEARRLHATNQAFAAEVAWWEERLAPLFDELGDVGPPADLWERIVARIDEPAEEVVRLRRKLNRWRAATAVAAATPVPPPSGTVTFLLLDLFRSGASDATDTEPLTPRASISNPTDKPFPSPTMLPLPTCVTACRPT